MTIASISKIHMDKNYVWRFWWHLHHSFKTHMEKILLVEDLIRFASIYKTHGEKNCFKIWWELHKFTKHMEKKFAWRFDESCINLQNPWRKYLLEYLMRFASIFCKTQNMEKIFGRRFDKICINILQNTNMEKDLAWRFDDNIAANYYWLLVGREEFGMKVKKKTCWKCCKQKIYLEQLKQQSHWRSCWSKKYISEVASRSLLFKQKKKSLNHRITNSFVAVEAKRLTHSWRIMLLLLQAEICWMQ